MLSTPPALRLTVTALVGYRTAADIDADGVLLTAVDIGAGRPTPKPMFPAWRLISSKESLVIPY